MRNVVLVPGFWHGTWCWNLVTEQLAARQIPSIAVDMTGQGLEGPSPSARWSRPFDAAAFATEPSAVASVTATTAAKALVERLRLIGGGDPSVVVAHSMGGVVATLAAEMEPALVSHVVYVAALVPVAGLPAGAYVTSDENEGELGTAMLRADPFAIGASRLDTGDASGRQAIREALYDDVPFGTVNAVLDLLNPDAPVGIAAESITVTPERFGALPHTYVTCSNDRMIRPPLQHRFVREIDEISATPTTVVPFDSSHSPFLSQPAALADTIAAAWQ
ncbi:alpha/beta hydrolase [Salinispora arenicola]|uniref:alpha/beta hydrolase n=1 Tax=Salinispora arenicola TaxID=168697 RepID=UPI00207A6693|nr:alpha/beta fold hydrolase [Salinispora arenicola]MCN0179526.1 alpha/beta fold hydrolase [Salinispora arenicola]